jgi:hypothetical protein
MAKRIGPEARIIALFTALPDDSKRIVMDVIKSQTAVPRKVSTKKAAKKTAESAVPTCVTCGNAESDPNHSTDSPEYHIFRTTLKKSRVNGEDKSQGASA